MFLRKKEKKTTTKRGGGVSFTWRLYVWNGRDRRHDSGEERTKFSINTSTNPTNGAEKLRGWNTVITRGAGTVTTVSGWSRSHFSEVQGFRIRLFRLQPNVLVAGGEGGGGEGVRWGASSGWTSWPSRWKHGNPRAVIMTAADWEVFARLLEEGGYKP